MLRSILRAVLSRCAACLSRHGLWWGLGLACGCYVLALCHQFLATFGTSLPFALSGAVAVALGCELGLRESRRARRMSSVESLAVHWMFLSGWVIVFPVLIAAVLLPLGSFELRVVAHPVATLAFALLAALLLLTLPAFWLSRVASAARERLPSAVSNFALVTGGNFRGVRGLLLALAVGLLLSALLVVPLLGVQLSSWIALACSSALVLSTWWRLSDEQVDVADTGVPAPVGSLPAIAGNAQRRDARSEAVCCWLLIAGIGAAFAVTSRMTRQLMPGVAYTFYAEWAALIMGCFAGHVWIRRTVRDAGDVSFARLAAVLWTAAWIVCLSAIFPLLIEVMLTANAAVSIVPVLQAVRVLTVCLLVIPLGAGWGALALRTTRAGSRDRGATLAGLSPLALVIGCFAAQASAIPMLGMHGTCIAAAWSLALLGLAAVLVTERSAWMNWLSQVLRRRLAASAAVVALLLIAVAPIMARNYDAALAARLLFSSQVTAAKVLGLDVDSLPVVDEGRIIAVTETSQSTYTVWKYRGNQLQIRENGIPKAVITSDPRVCPHFSAELMQAALPLVLHERPHRVLLLGLQGGVPLATCLNFPVMSVTCVEADEKLPTIVEQSVWANCVEPPAPDDRLSSITASPALALACGGETYDVIVSSPDQAALLQSLPSYTVEFYRRAALKLAPEGIFCQRFRWVDFGPRPLQVAVRTLSRAFAQVAAIETAPGEMLLVATNAESGLVRPGLIERLRAPQVRHALGQVGWDWVVPLGLATYGAEKLQEFAATAPVNTSANGWYAFRLPQEVMRWGAKSQEAYEQLAPRAENLVAWGACPVDDPDLVQRLSDLNAQRKLMSEAQDQYWEYRKVVRKQVSERPRSIIQQVSGEEPRRALHPEELRRVEYFEHLGRALRSETPRLDQIQQVTEFEKPYDPLISFFLHGEVVRLYARLDGAAAEELQHRLHWIYYGDQSDRSVRNVADSVRLLAEHPEAVPNAEIRWDNLNGLLQMLKVRWETRSAIRPTSVHVALSDVDQSIAAVEAAFAVMDELSGQVHDDPDHWPARKAYLDKTLVRPLRTYRQQLLPHHVRHRRKQETAAARDAYEAGADDATAESL